MPQPASSQMSLQAPSQAASQRYAHLLQPIKELSASWNIDIAGELNEYLAELALIRFEFSGAAQPLNFAEAALLIQGSTVIYSKKVEYLYALLTRTMAVIDHAKSSKHRAGAQSTAAAAAAAAAAVGAAEDSDDALDDGPAASRRAQAGRTARAAQATLEEEFLLLDEGEWARDASEIDLADDPLQRMLMTSSGLGCNGGLGSLAARASAARLSLALRPIEEGERAGDGSRRGDFRMNMAAVHPSGALLLGGIAPSAADLARQPSRPLLIAEGDDVRVSLRDLDVPLAGAANATAAEELVTSMHSYGTTLGNDDIDDDGCGADYGADFTAADADDDNDDPMSAGMAENQAQRPMNAEISARPRRTVNVAVAKDVVDEWAMLDPYAVAEDRKPRRMRVGRPFRAPTDAEIAALASARVEAPPALEWALPDRIEATGPLLPQFKELYVAELRRRNERRRKAAGIGGSRRTSAAPVASATVSWAELDYDGLSHRGLGYDTTPASVFAEEPIAAPAAAPVAVAVDGLSAGAANLDDIDDDDDDYYHAPAFDDYDDDLAAESRVAAAAVGGVSDCLEAPGTRMAALLAASPARPMAREGPSYEDLCRMHIARYVAESEQYATQTDLSRRVADWQSRIDPVLAAEEARRPFDMQEYEGELLTRFAAASSSDAAATPGDPSSAPHSFLEVVGAESGVEVCRLFLAALTLTNLGEFDIEPPAASGAAFRLRRILPPADSSFTICATRRRSTEPRPRAVVLRRASLSTALKRAPAAAGDEENTVAVSADGNPRAGVTRSTAKPPARSGSMNDRSFSSSMNES